MVTRDWELVVTAKRMVGEGEHASYFVTFQEPRDAAIDWGRPYWASKSEQGAPLELKVHRWEWSAIVAGDKVTISISVGAHRDDEGAEVAGDGPDGTVDPAPMCAAFMSRRNGELGTLETCDRCGYVGGFVHGRGWVHLREALQ